MPVCVVVFCCKGQRLLARASCVIVSCFCLWHVQGIKRVVQVSAFKNDGVEEAFHAIIKAPKKDDLLGVCERFMESHCA